MKTNSSLCEKNNNDAWTTDKAQHLITLDKKLRCIVEGGVMLGKGGLWYYNERVREDQAPLGSRHHPSTGQGGHCRGHAGHTQL